MIGVSLTRTKYWLLALKHHNNKRTHGFKEWPPQEKMYKNSL